MKNAVSGGKTIEIATPSGGYTSGQPVKVSDLVGISHSTYLQGDVAVIELCGCYTVAKAAEAWTAGDKLYWDDTNKVFTKTATNNTLAGYAWAAALSAAGTGVILLRQ